MTEPRVSILVVDDDFSIRMSISHVLTELGHFARSADDGFTALLEIHQEIPNILLTDLNMPGISGFELLSVVRRSFPSIQTIAMSGSFSGNEVPSGVAADAFYEKGSSTAALFKIIQSRILPRRIMLNHPAESSIGSHQNIRDNSAMRSGAISPMQTPRLCSNLSKYYSSTYAKRIVSIDEV